MKKCLFWLLLISLILTLMVPFTGVVVHKLASTVFLLLCGVHTAAARQTPGPRRWALLALVGAAFLSGVLGLVWEELPWVLAVHKALSMACVFFLAIHIFVCRHGFKGD